MIKVRLGHYDTIVCVETEQHGLTFDVPPSLRVEGGIGSRGVVQLVALLNEALKQLQEQKS